jgi:hypothetical protein
VKLVVSTVDRTVEMMVVMLADWKVVRMDGKKAARLADWKVARWVDQMVVLKAGLWVA